MAFPLLGDNEQEHVLGREYAVYLDAQDSLRHMRDEFHIPTRSQLRAKSLSEAVSRDIESVGGHDDTTPSIYLCGNSLGLQPKLTSQRIQQYLSTWSSQGVYGHFKPLEESPLPTWLNADDEAAKAIAPIVGARTAEVAVMETLTANLHLLMSAFYKPDFNSRHKIILESKAFPSDHYAVESQIRHHGLDPSQSMVTIEPISESNPVITTQQVLSLINEHGPTTALLLLPGIQYYTGQLLDIPTITAAAHDAGIFILIDLAHAVGNVPLSLHDWNVDAAAWCSYKYLNAGPGSIGGLFIHEKHTSVVRTTDDDKPEFRNRLSGWWGHDKSSRFKMENNFVPISGAAGFQLSNPSIFDITSLTASLSIFAKAGGVGPLRLKSLQLTAYLENLLLHTKAFQQRQFSIITPKSPNERGAQLSLKLEDGLLEGVMAELEHRGVVVDERRPDVIRVAPAPLYNSFVDVWEFVEAWEVAVDVAFKAKRGEVEVEGTAKLEVTS